MELPHEINIRVCAVLEDRALAWSDLASALTDAGYHGLCSILPISRAEWDFRDHQRAHESFELVLHLIPAAIRGSIAVQFARHVLAIWERERADDRRPHELIENGLAAMQNPSGTIPIPYSSNPHEFADHKHSCIMDAANSAQQTCFDNDWDAHEFAMKCNDEEFLVYHHDNHLFDTAECAYLADSTRANLEYQVSVTLESLNRHLAAHA